jgi:hypothetical protein
MMGTKVIRKNCKLASCGKEFEIVIQKRNGKVLERKRGRSWGLNRLYCSREHAKQAWTEMNKVRKQKLRELGDFVAEFDDVVAFAKQ